MEAWEVFCVLSRNVSSLWQHLSFRMVSEPDLRNKYFPWAQHVLYAFSLQEQHSLVGFHFPVTQYNDCMMHNSLPPQSPGLWLYNHKLSFLQCVEIYFHPSFHFNYAEDSKQVLLGGERKIVWGFLQDFCIGDNSA